MKFTYAEDAAAGKKYRDRMIGETDRFLDMQIKRAERERAEKYSPENYLEHEESFRKELIEMLGFPLHRETEFPLGTCHKKTPVYADGQTIVSRMEIEAFRGVCLYGILIEPAAVREKSPFVIAQHGGYGTPESVCGFVFGSENYNRMAERFAKRGAIVFAPQLYNWHSELYGTENKREKYNAVLRQLGGSVTALEVLLLKRAIDYFEHTPAVDKNKIGIVGLSYGGMHALMAGAVDKRIKCVYSSCFFNDRLKYNWNDLSYSGQLKSFMDAQIGALIAPRALYIEAADRDCVFSCDTAAKEFSSLYEYYKIRGAEENLRFHVFEGEHELDKKDGGIDFFMDRLQREG